MAALDIRLLLERLDVGPVAAICQVKGFIDGAEVNSDNPYVGTMFAKLVNTLAAAVPEQPDNLGADPSPQTPRSQAPAEAIRPPQVEGGDQVKHMVDRFLSWKLPGDFRPDNGISFDPVANAGTSYAHAREPSGTNLFDAYQAEVMVRYMLEGVPSPAGVLRIDIAREDIHWNALQTIRHALQPFVDLLIHRRRDDDDYCVDLYMVPDPADAYRPYRLVNLGHARALVRAAGLWTSAMDAVVDGALVADAATTREASSSPEAPSATPEAVAAPPPPAPSREDEDIPF